MSTAKETKVAVKVTVFCLDHSHKEVAVLNPPTVAEAIKHAGFNTEQPFCPDKFSIRLNGKEISPDEFTAAVVLNGDVIMVAKKDDCVKKNETTKVVITLIPGGGKAVTELNPPTLAEAVRQAGLLCQPQGQGQTTLNPYHYDAYLNKVRVTGKENVRELYENTTVPDGSAVVILRRIRFSFW